MIYIPMIIIDTSDTIPDPLKPASTLARTSWGNEVLAPLHELALGTPAQVQGKTHHAKHPNVNRKYDTRRTFLRP